MNPLAALIIAIAPPLAEPIEQRVACIDVNHVLNEHGTVFTQAVFIDRYPAYERSEIVTWRMIRDNVPRPERDHARGDYVMTWQDGDVLRRVRAWTVWESYEAYDYELARRADFPPCKRRELLNPKP